MPKKIRIGTVTSNKMMNTVTVESNSMKVHPLYRKKYRVTKRFHADTDGKTYEIGDIVKIEEVRPISKTKSWKVVSKATSLEETESK